MINGTRCYRIHFRARCEWDGLDELWLLFVHPTGKKIITEEDEKQRQSFRAKFVLKDVMAVDTMEDDGDDETMEGVEQEKAWAVAAENDIPVGMPVTTRELRGGPGCAG